jgi:hypothetical protein
MPQLAQSHPYRISMTTPPQNVQGRLTAPQS